MYKVKYVLGEAPKKNSGGSQTKAKKSEPSYQDALIEHKISWLAKLDWKSDEAKRLFEDLKADTNANQVCVT